MSKPESFIQEAERLLALVESEPTLDALAHAGRIDLVLPGLSTLSAAILAAWHGRYGHFPRIRWYIRDSKSGTFSLSDKYIDLQNIRYEARRGRGTVR